MIDQIRHDLKKQGLSDNVIHEVATYALLSDLAGGDPTDELSSLVADVASHGFATIGYAVQFIIENSDWIAAAATSGIIGNRTDAAILSIVRRLQKQRTIRDLPELTLQNATVNARHAIIRTFSLPRTARFSPQGQEQQPDGSWILTFHCWTGRTVDAEEHDGWRYSAHVLHISDTEQSERGRFAATRVKRVRS
ncbi:hypothetical protein ACFFTK_31250 [Pseudonocardia petroleophila]|uniref:Uncharacterized protein n=1 Tax=Pseudonocardia petroleophila TaxID=37331 RepID=A0A7G7MKJ9_9PSEU|nr:hypothetical protein [Pseudonocardia petroleophila]QNG53310.1 hypothetical protein H6H00_04765 [Pseudonocardia petroleophila]